MANLYPENNNYSNKNPDAQKNSSGFTQREIMNLIQQPELRFPDNPYNMELADLTAAMPEDAYLQDLFGHVVDSQAGNATLGMASDPFWPNYPAQGSIPLNPGMVVCGIMPTGDPIVIPFEKFFCNLGVFGRTGSSKTSLLTVPVLQLINAGFRVVVFEKKNEYCNWASCPELAGKVLPLKCSDFMLSLGQGLKGTDKRRHIHSLFDNLGRSYGRLYSQRLAEDIWVAQEKRLPKDMHPPLSLFIEALEDYRPGRGGVEARYKESMLHTVKDIKNCFGDIFDYYHSDFLDRLYEWKGLITITIDKPIEGSTLFITEFVKRLYQKRKQSGKAASSFQPTIFVLEDSTVLADEKELEGRSPLIPMTFMSRMYNMGFCYCAHTISGSNNQKLLSNLESNFIFGISGENTRDIQKMLGCTAQQARMAQTLNPGQFIALIPSFHPEAVFGEFPYVKPPGKITEQQRQDIIKPFLDSVKVIKYNPRGLPEVIKTDTSPAAEPQTTADKDTASVDSIELRFLVMTATGKSLTKTQLYDQLGLTRRKGRKIYKQLEKKGLIRDHSFGKPTFPEVLEPGLNIIESRGFERPKTTGGGFEHEIGVELIERKAKKPGYRFNREVDLFGKRLDAKATDPKTGKSIFFNVGISDPEREADNLIQIAKIRVVKQNKLVFVARDSKFAKKVEKLLKDKDSSGDVLKSLEIKKISDLVNG